MQGEEKRDCSPPEISDGMCWINTKGVVVRWCTHSKAWLPNDEIYYSMSGKWLPRSKLETLPVYARPPDNDYLKKVAIGEIGCFVSRTPAQ